MTVRSWDDKQPLAPNDILVCGICAVDEKTKYRLEEEFFQKAKPLRTLDLFAGVGAFGHGLNVAGCIQITHAVEISPSAAETFR